MRVDSRIPNIERIRELQAPHTQEKFCDLCGIPKMSLYRIYTGHRAALETLEAIAAYCSLDVEELILPTSDKHLCGRISQLGLWPDLADAVRNAVIIGGISAMRTYTEEARDLIGSSLGNRVVEEILREIIPCKNPTIQADIDAMLAVIRTANLFISPLTDKLGCSASYLSEELIEHKSSFAPYFGEVAARIHGPRDFFEFDHNMRVLIDPLDGSMNHKRSIPMFCSAAAILVEDQPRVAAVFDPFHNIAYSAFLSGPYDKPEKQSVAMAWEIDAGHTLDLVGMARHQRSEAFESEAIAVHLSRKSRDKRQEMIDRLNTISESYDSVYMLNSGTMAMVLVVKDKLKAFVNPWTNLHDVAAGEVLCRATGCVVTDWDGKPIQYNNLEKTKRVIL